MVSEPRLGETSEKAKTGSQQRRSWAQSTEKKRHDRERGRWSSKRKSQSQWGTAGNGKIFSTFARAGLAWSDQTQEGPSQLAVPAGIVDS